MNRILATTLILSLGAAPALAGAVAEFETAYNTAYANYRTALFATNSGDATKSGGALKQLDGTWTELAAQYRANPPPQVEDDPLWGQTALLHKSTDGRVSPFPGQTHPTALVTGMPSAVKPLRTATRTWNSAT